MPRQRLIVIGGDAAGMSAASQARGRNADLDIIVKEFLMRYRFNAV